MKVAPVKPDSTIYAMNRNGAPLAASREAKVTTALLVLAFFSIRLMIVMTRGQLRLDVAD